jgi:hypothetical protein
MTEQNESAKAQVNTAVEAEHAKEMMQKWQAKATNYEKELEKFKNVDVEEYKALKEEIQLLRRENAKDDPKKIEEVITKEKATIEKELQSRYGKKFEEFEGKLAESQKELSRLRVVNPAMLKAAERFNSSELTLIQLLVEKDLTYIDGQISVLGDDGKPRPSVKDPRNTMGLDEYLDLLAEKYPGCAKPKGKSGAREGGMAESAQGRTSGSITVEKYLQMTPQERQQIPLKERGILANQALSQKR